MRKNPHKKKLDRRSTISRHYEHYVMDLATWGHDQEGHVVTVADDSERATDAPRPLRATRLARCSRALHSAARLSCEAVLQPLQWSHSCKSTTPAEITHHVRSYPRPRVRLGLPILRNRRTRPIITPHSGDSRRSPIIYIRCRRTHHKGQMCGTASDGHATKWPTAPPYACFARATDTKAGHAA